MPEEERQVVAKWQYNEMIKTLESLVEEGVEDGGVYAPSITAAIDKILNILDLEYEG